MRALANFKAGKTRVLVASDIAARGLDVDDISHVINYDLPNVAETYVHRIGRTGRAGASGQAISFCSDEQRDDLREIERLLGKAIPVLHHSIRTEPADCLGGWGESQSGPGELATHAHAPVNSASPQQQRNEFWRGRRRRGPQGRGQSKPRLRRHGR